MGGYQSFLSVGSLRKKGRKVLTGKTRGRKIAQKKREERERSRGFFREPVHARGKV